MPRSPLTLAMVMAAAMVALLTASASTTGHIRVSAPPIPIDEILAFAEVQYTTVYKQWLSSKHRPPVLPDYGMPSESWWRNDSVTSGYFQLGFAPGIFWNLYSATGGREWLEAAQATTATVAVEATNNQTHDVGFMMIPFMLGHTLTNNASYLRTLTTAAKSLSSRFSPVVGCTRSWNSPAPSFLVIIDNMMNLELLYMVANLTNNQMLYRQAFSHANRTMHEHFRPSNYSTYHVVEYNETDGSVMRKYTAQGYADWSTWARGQSWAVHGFTMSYRFTRHRPFLDTAIRAAQLFLNRTLAEDPSDPTPFWDFNAPHDVYQPRDTSSAAIASSGILELLQYIDPASALYKQLYRGVVTVLQSLVSNHMNSHSRFGPLPSLLVNATQGPYTAGNMHHPYDVAMIYGDYYFTEALLRLRVMDDGDNGAPRVSSF